MCKSQNQELRVQIVQCATVYCCVKGNMYVTEYNCIIVVIEKQM